MGREDLPSFLSRLSSDEQECLTGQLNDTALVSVLNFFLDPDYLFISSGMMGGDALWRQSEVFWDCLDDENVYQVYFEPVEAAKGPLSSETRECMRNALKPEDIRTMQSRDITEPRTSEDSRVLVMTYFGVTALISYCFNDEEWERSGDSFYTPEIATCVVWEMGGPRQLVKDTVRADQDAEDNLGKARRKCEPAG